MHLARPGLALALAIGLSACADPTCEEVVEHLTAKLGEANGDKLAECKEEPWSASLRSCLANVTVEREYTRCLARFRGLRAMSKPNPARASLDRLAKQLKAHYIETASLPTTSAPLTPGTSCCEDRARLGRCAPDPARWTSAPWSELGFAIDDPHAYRYALDVIDPLREVVVRAVGDLDCDGIEITYELRATVVDRAVTTRITEPARLD